MKAFDEQPGLRPSGVDSRCEEALSHYAPFMTSDYHHELTRRTLAWSLELTKNLDDRRHAKEAFLSSTFEVFCAPPDATPQENFISMKFLLVFFRADDAPPTLLDDFIPWIDGLGSGATGELGAYYNELLLDFDTMRRDASGFREALRGMCTSMQERSELTR